MTFDNPSGSPPFLKHSAVAGGIAVLTACLLALLCADVVRDFFPYAEEWKIMLPSLPQFADPAEWFLGFARTMGDPYPAWAVSAINFFRPVMNVVYWLRGAMFGADWGAYLYFNFACLGIAAGALYLCLRTFKLGPDVEAGGSQPGLALSLVLVAVFVLMPPMVSAAARFLPLLVPQFPFDRLLVALGLLACLSYVYRRFVLAALLLAAALLTKEQALPLAMALPLTHVWLRRRSLRESLPALLILSAPVLAWIAVRLLLFGSVSQGVYVLLDEPASVVYSLVVSLLKLPLYAPSLSGALRDPLSIPALLVACNGILLAYLSIDVIKRWWDNGPDVVSVAFIGYWSFLAIVGLNPRYGALMIALAILMVARRQARGVPPIARAIALGALVVTGLVHGALSLRSYDTHVAFSKTIYQVGRDYAAALSDVEAGTDAVVVLNDPNTMYTAPSDLARVLELPVTSVHKVSDFSWRWPDPYATSIPEQPCEVTVEVIRKGTIELNQSCGLQVMGGLVPHENPPVLSVMDGVEAVFPQASFNEDGRLVDLGKRLILHVRRPNVDVLYFEPETRSFHWVQYAAGAAPHSQGSDDT